MLDGRQEDGPREIVRNDGRVGVIRVAGCCRQFRLDEVTGWTLAGHTGGAVGIAVAILVLEPGLVRVFQGAVAPTSTWSSAMSATGTDSIRKSFSA